MKWTQWRLLEEESGEACLEPQQLVSSVSQSAWGCGLLVSHKCACSIKQNVSGPTTCEVHRCILSSTTVLMRHRNAGVSSPPAKEADFQVLCHWKQLWAPWFRLHEGSTYRQEHFLDEQSAGEFSQHLRDPSRGSCLFLFPGSQRMFLPFKCAPGKFSIKPGWHRPALHQQWLQSLSSRVVVDQLAGRAQDGLAGPLRRCSGKVPHIAMMGQPLGFSRVTAGFSSYDGDLRLPLGLALGSPNSHMCLEWLPLESDFSLWLKPK